MSKEDKEKKISDTMQEIIEAQKTAEAQKIAETQKNYKTTEQARALWRSGDKIFNGRIEIKNIELSEEQVSKQVDERIIIYTDQMKIFKKHIKDINDGKETFYPKEAKSLLQEYVKALGPLIDGFIEMKKNGKNA